VGNNFSETVHEILNFFFADFLENFLGFFFFEGGFFYFFSSLPVPVMEKLPGTVT